MTTTEPVPLTPAAEIPAALGPLARSHTATDLEEAAQKIFLAVFETMLRPKINAIETLAIAHRASSDVVRQAITADGLALERPDAADDHMRQLYRAWRARNPRRGLSFLTHYLQMLWPGLWQCKQLWQDPELPYPTGTVSQERPGHFLTSRVLVSVEHPDPSGEALGKMRGSFRSVLAARLVILVALLRSYDNALHLACAFHCIDMVGVPAMTGVAPTVSPPTVVYMHVAVVDGSPTELTGKTLDLINGGPDVVDGRIVGNSTGWLEVAINSSHPPYPYSIKIIGASVSGAQDTGLRNEIVYYGDWSGGSLSVFGYDYGIKAEGFNSGDVDPGILGPVAVAISPAECDVEIIFFTESQGVVKVDGAVVASSSSLKSEGSGFWGVIGLFSVPGSIIGTIGPHFSCREIKFLGAD